MDLTNNHLKAFLCSTVTTKIKLPSQMTIRGTSMSLACLYSGGCTRMHFLTQWILVVTLINWFEHGWRILQN